MGIQVYRFCILKVLRASLSAGVLAVLGSQACKELDRVSLGQALLADTDCGPKPEQRRNFLGTRF